MLDIDCSSIDVLIKYMLIRISGYLSLCHLKLNRKPDLHLYDSKLLLTFRRESEECSQAWLASVGGRSKRTLV